MFVNCHMICVKKMILLLLISQAEMDIIHKFKFNFSVQKLLTCKYIYLTWLAENGDSLCTDVQYNKTLISNTLPRITAFYFNHLLQSQGIFIFSEKYEKLCSTS